MPRYRVTVSRVEYQEAVVEVEADDENAVYGVWPDYDVRWNTVNANESVELVEPLDDEPDQVTPPERSQAPD